MRVAEVEARRLQQRRQRVAGVALQPIGPRLAQDHLDVGRVLCQRVGCILQAQVIVPIPLQQVDQHQADRTPLRAHAHGALEPFHGEVRVAALLLQHAHLDMRVHVALIGFQRGHQHRFGLDHTALVHQQRSQFHIRVRVAGRQRQRLPVRALGVVSHPPRLIRLRQRERRQRVARMRRRGRTIEFERGVGVTLLLIEIGQLDARLHITGRGVHRLLELRQCRVGLPQRFLRPSQAHLRLRPPGIQRNRILIRFRRQHRQPLRQIKIAQPLVILRQHRRIPAFALALIERPLIEVHRAVDVAAALDQPRQQIEHAHAVVHGKQRGALACQFAQQPVGVVTRVARRVLFAGRRAKLAARLPGRDRARQPRLPAHGLRRGHLRKGHVQRLLLQHRRLDRIAARGQQVGQLPIGIGKTGVVGNRPPIGGFRTGHVVAPSQRIAQHHLRPRQVRGRGCGRAVIVHGRFSLPQILADACQPDIRIGAAAVAPAWAKAVGKRRQFEAVQRRLIRVDGPRRLALPLQLVAQPQPQHRLVRVGADGRFQQVQHFGRLPAQLPELIAQRQIDRDLRRVEPERLLIGDGRLVGPQHRAVDVALQRIGRGVVGLVGQHIIQRHLRFGDAPGGQQRPRQRQPCRVRLLTGKLQQPNRTAIKVLRSGVFALRRLYFGGKRQHLGGKRPLPAHHPQQRPRLVVMRLLQIRARQHQLVGLAGLLPRRLLIQRQRPVRAPALTPQVRQRNQRRGVVGQVAVGDRLHKLVGRTDIVAHGQTGVARGHVIARHIRRLLLRQVELVHGARRLAQLRMQLAEPEVQHRRIDIAQRLLIQRQRVVEPPAGVGDLGLPHQRQQVVRVLRQCALIQGRGVVPLPRGQRRVAAHRRRGRRQRLHRVEAVGLVIHDPGKPVGGQP